MSHVQLATARSREALRAVAEKHAAGLLAAGVSRSEAEWRRRIASIRETLTALTAECDRTTRLPELTASADALSELVEAVAETASADAENSVRQLQLQAREEVATARSFADRLEAELRFQDQELRAAREQLEQEQAARTRAEAAAVAADALAKNASTRSRTDAAAFEARLEQLQGQLQNSAAELSATRADLTAERAARVHAEAAVETAGQTHAEHVAALRTQLQEQAAAMRAQTAEASALRQRVEAGQVDRANLLGALEVVREAVHRAAGAIHPLSPALLPADTPVVAEHQTVQPDAPTATTGIPGTSSSDLASAIASHASTADPLTRIDHRDSAGTEELATDSAMRAYTRDLLQEVESMYCDDVKSGLQPMEVVDRLSANLRHRRHVLITRFQSAAPEATTVFDECVNRSLDAKADTLFGRHLGMAAYEVISS